MKISTLISKIGVASCVLLLLSSWSIGSGMQPSLSQTSTTASSCTSTCTSNTLSTSTQDSKKAAVDHNHTPEQYYNCARSYTKERSNNINTLKMNSNNPANIRLAKLAFKSYYIAAQKGHVKSMLKVADCYHRGLGVGINLKKSAEYCCKAANNNNPSGCFNLAVCCDNGFGVQEDQKMATDFFIRAFLLGFKSSEEALGNAALCNKKHIYKIKNFDAIMLRHLTDSDRCYFCNKCVDETEEDLTMTLCHPEAVYHETCFEQHANNTCPVCKTNDPQLFEAPSDADTQDTDTKDANT